MTKSLTFVALLFLGACSSGGGDSSPASPSPPERDTAQVQAFADSIRDLSLADFYEVSYLGLLARTPQAAVSLGLDEAAGIGTGQLNDLSGGYAADTADMLGIALDTLRSYDRDGLDGPGKIDYDVYEWYLSDAIERASYEAFGFPGTYGNFGEFASLQRFFTDVHPLETAADAEAYLERLGAVDDQLAQLESLILRQRDLGVIEPEITMQVAINQLGSIVDDPSRLSPFFTTFRDGIADIAELSDAERSDLEGRALNATATNVLPAYRHLRDTLAGLIEVAPDDIGVGQYPGGDGYYAYELRHHTTTDLTPAEIHELGLAELERIRAGMQDRFDQLGYPRNENLAQLLRRVANDGGTVRAADGLASFESIIANAEAMLTQAFDVLPSSDVVVKTDPFGGFYIGPSLDGSRPGAFFAGTEIDQPYYLMPSLTYHESVPGHHLQIGIAADQDVPTFRKVVRNTAYVEGWALYAERLAFELGWYDNDIYGDLGRLQYEALRASRLVMDTGIHADQYDWGFNEAADFNQRNTGFSIASSQGAAARYSISPGQATGYMIGMLRILEERERAETALGADFDLKDFHGAVLTAGAVPLDVLTTVVDQYIVAAQSGR